MMDNKRSKHFRLRMTDEEWATFESLVGQYHDVLKLRVSRQSVAKQAFDRGCQAIMDEVIGPAVANEAHIS